MNIPNLPTDNLYKFVALTGMIIVILSAYFMITKVAEVSDKIYDLEEQLEIINAKHNYSIEKINNLKSNISCETYQLKECDKEIITKDEIDVMKKDVNGLKKEIHLDAHANDIRVIQFKINKKRTEELHKRSKYIYYYSIFFGVIGFILAYYGFYMWYIKVQYYQDLLIKKQAEISSK